MSVQVNYVDTYEGNRYPIEEIVKAICKLNDKIGTFWSKCAVWAPCEAAKLLGLVRLDWQTELSRCLFMWIEDDQSRKSEGHLILAWVNLGSLLEGTLKFFLSVYLEEARIAGIRPFARMPNSPESLMLGQLRQFFIKNNILNEEGEALVELVQKRRNVVPAFKDANIATWDEFVNAVRRYYSLLHNLEGRLPYPNEF